MKNSARYLIGCFTLGLATIPSLGHAQSAGDWVRFGFGIADAAINTANGGKGQRRPNYAPAPNASGSTNFGSFNNSGFFNSSRPNNTYYSRPSNNYYSRPSNTYYSRPSNSYSSQRVVSSRPVYADPPKAPSNLSIEIRCPSWCDGICNYDLVSARGTTFPYQIRGGEKQRLKETTNWIIRYDQGQGLGKKTYRLRGGNNYELRRNDNGTWVFYMSS